MSVVMQILRTGGSVAFAKVPAQVAPSASSSSSNCLKQLLFNGNNKLARFVGGTKNVDKALKLTKSVSEVVQASLEVSGDAGIAHATAKNIAGGVGTARSFIALTNAFNGALPGCIRSTKECFSHVKQCFGPSEGMEAAFANSKTPKAYNKIYLNKRDHILAAVREGCSAVGSATFLATFGAVRPVLLANKLSGKQFLCSDAKTQLNNSVTYMMTANHAASVIGSAVGIAAERIAYERAISSLGHSSEAYGWSVENRLDVEASLKQSYISEVKKAVLTILEKGLELIADIVKLVPTGLSAAGQMIVTSSLVTVSSCVGLYCAWSKS
ncbi:hypothetical protein CP10139811_0843 [Chlamydia ibidis]|uniref:Uncharacterized protein n=2 Tax=Chlamydia ibidis TaxID=1405396 RepID=S7J3T9_9CHLA|nr:hypothetical protein [Chlamydia ibidis]EPP34888.1 hypothetical protein CP10139811_0843 [Chlamydia ibidis]EQM63141.1 hypothetical protein H359_0163 [Chlamydia ibidis 10-1398/6]